MLWQPENGPLSESTAMARGVSLVVAMTDDPLHRELGVNLVDMIEQLSRNDPASAKGQRLRGDCIRLARGLVDDRDTALAALGLAVPIGDRIRALTEVANSDLGRRVAVLQLRVEFLEGLAPNATDNRGRHVDAIRRHSGETPESTLAHALQVLSQDADTVELAGRLADALRARGFLPHPDESLADAEWRELIRLLGAYGDEIDREDHLMVSTPAGHRVWVVISRHPLPGDAAPAYRVIDLSGNETGFHRPDR